MKDYNIQTIKDFAYLLCDEDPTAQHIASVLAQFIMSIRNDLQAFSHDVGIIITDRELISIEIKALRQCVLDLEKAREFIKGEVLQ